MFISIAFDDDSMSPVLASYGPVDSESTPQREPSDEEEKERKEEEKKKEEEEKKQEEKDKNNKDKKAKEGEGKKEEEEEDDDLSKGLVDDEGDEDEDGLGEEDDSDEDEGEDSDDDSDDDSGADDGEGEDAGDDSSDSDDGGDDSDDLDDSEDGDAGSDKSEASAMSTVVVCGFPGVGKSSLAQALPPGTVSDSDSSMFPKDQFPSNYMRHIRGLMKANQRMVLTSSHTSVRSALEQNNINFILAYPDASLLEEYVARYRNRGSEDKFIAMVEDNWHEWIQECQAQTGCEHRILQAGEYLGDVLSPEIEAFT